MIEEHRRPPEQTLFFLFCNSAQKLPSSSGSFSLRSHHCHRRQRNDDHSWRTTCLSPQAVRSVDPLASNRVVSIKGRNRGPGSRSRRQRQPLARRPAWQAPSSSSWRRRGPWSCEVSPPSEPLACSDWCSRPGPCCHRTPWLGSACSCRLNWKIVLDYCQDQCDQQIIKHYLRTCPPQEDNVETHPFNSAE